MLQGTYFILVESMPGKFRKYFVFNFNYSVWMNTFCHNVCCIYVQWLWDLRRWHSHNINIMIHATYTSSEKEAALGLSQLGVSFLADSNSWNVNGTTNLSLWGRCSRVLSQLASDNVLAQPNALFISWVKNQISSTKFSIFKSMVTG